MGMQIFLGFLGVCIGMVIASGVVAFIITLGIVPRYAGITRTARQVRLYENCSMLGAFLGNIFFLYQGSFPLGIPGLLVLGKLDHCSGRSGKYLFHYAAKNWNNERDRLDHHSYGFGKDTGVPALF